MQENGVDQVSPHNEEDDKSSESSSDSEEEGLPKPIDADAKDKIIDEETTKL